MGILLVSVLLVAATVTIHALGTNHWVRFVTKQFLAPDGYFKAHEALPAVTWTAVVLLLLHVVEIVVWALAYLLWVPGDELSTF